MTYVGAWQAGGVKDFSHGPLVLALIAKNDRVFADSRDVANRFDKRHDHTIRTIRGILAADPGAAPSFEEGSYADFQGQMRPHYLTDRDGFMMLVMGFTGAEAIRWRRSFIAAFNRMETELRKPAAPRPS